MDLKGIKISKTKKTKERNQKGITLIVTIILIKVIGNNDFGILILAQSYMSIMDILINIQSWRSVTLYGQEAMVENNEDNLHAYIKLGCVMDIITAIFCIFVAIFLAPIIGNIFGWSSNQVLFSQIYSITIISHFSGTPTAILRLLDKFKLVEYYPQKFKIKQVLTYVDKDLNPSKIKPPEYYPCKSVFSYTDFRNNVLTRKQADYYNSKVNQLPKEFTRDGVHLLPQYYDRWAEVIRPLIYD